MIVDKKKKKTVSAIIIGGRNTESYPIPCLTIIRQVLPFNKFSFIYIYIYIYMKKYFIIISIA